MNQFKRIIIFGHSGFIGKHLVQFLNVAHPALECIGFSDTDVDLTDAKCIDRISHLFRQDTGVVMLAAIKPNIADDLTTCQQNIAMVANLCRALAMRPVGRLVYMSSAAVYGEDVVHTKITEDTPVAPRSYYGLAKFTGEQLLWKTLVDQAHSSLFILRPPVVYGPGEARAGYNPSGFLQKAYNGETITLWGDGRERREFIYIDDMVNILDYFLFSKRNGTANVASGNSYSFMQVIAHSQKILKRTISFVSRKRNKRNVDHRFDNALLRRLMPGIRFTSLSDGLSRTYDAMQRV